MTYDKEKAAFNITRLKKGGETFEIIVNPDEAIAFRKGENIDIKDVLYGESILSNAQRGLHASEETMKAVFKTENVTEIAKIILKEGDIQLTSEYRQKLRDEKRKKIIATIARNAIDPRTSLPHPIQRIENAFEECKVKVEELKSAEEQISDIVKKLRPILPIKFEVKILQIDIPSTFAPKMYSAVAGFGEMQDQKWNSDGSWTCKVKVPAGMQMELIDKLNSQTHGGVNVKVLE
jgi:ribosome maturation protein SDO1